jgi:hypothetical protein
MTYDSPWAVKWSTKVTNSPASEPISQIRKQDRQLANKESNITYIHKEFPLSQIFKKPLNFGDYVFPSSD